MEHKTDKNKTQELMFCLHYSQMRNIKEAAIHAGFPTESAEEQGYKLLRSRAVQARIKQFEQSQQQNELLQFAVAGLKRLALAPVNDCVRLLQNPDSPKLAEQLDLFHVAELKLKDGACEIKFFDRYKALEKLCELAENQDSGNDAADFYKALKQSADAMEERGSNEA